MDRQNDLRELIDKLEIERKLKKEEWIRLIDGRTPELAAYLSEKAVKIRRRYYDNHVFIRGLIEVSNICKNDCFYCGIRRSNRNADRYHLTRGEILQCCREGYELGFRTLCCREEKIPIFLML